MLAALQAKLGGIDDHVFKAGSCLSGGVVERGETCGALTGGMLAIGNEVGGERLEDVERRAGIDARLVVDEELEIPAEFEVELLHISQEALNNALKHSKAAEVVLSLRADEDNLRLEVVDNGQGFDLELARGKGGMGLTNMSERVEKIAGKLTIQSGPDSGTTIRVIASIVSPEDSQTGLQTSSDHPEV